jgi:hypothetical protein
MLKVVSPRQVVVAVGRPVSRTGRILAGQKVDMAGIFGGWSRSFSGRRFRRQHRAGGGDGRGEGDRCEVLRQVFKALTSTAGINGGLRLRLPPVLLEGVVLWPML